jgi:hypothetical protein
MTLALEILWKAEQASFRKLENPQKMCYDGLSVSFDRLTGLPRRNIRFQHSITD